MAIVGNWEATGINVVALGLTFAPDFAEHKYKIKLPIDYVFVLVAFIYMSMFLGSVYEAYERIFWWDVMLHITSGIVLSFAAYLILYIMHMNKRLMTTPFLIALLTFSFGLAFGAVWEIFEFTMDSVFATNMQRNGLDDTMWDLIVDGAGALLVALIGYDIIKNKREGGIMHRAIDRFIKSNER